MERDHRAPPTPANHRSRPASEGGEDVRVQRRPRHVGDAQQHQHHQKQRQKRRSHGRRRRRRRRHRRQDHEDGEEEEEGHRRVEPPGYILLRALIIPAACQVQIQIRQIETEGSSASSAFLNPD